MARSILLNSLVVVVVVAFAAVVAVPAEETILSHGDPRDPAVLTRLIDEMGEDFLLLDVRTPAEFTRGHIPSAVNIAHDAIESAMIRADRSTPIVLYCRSGARSARAMDTLLAMGFTAVHDFGAMSRWSGELEQ